MKGYIIIAVGVLISLIVQILSYSKISEKEIKKIEIKDVIFIDFMVLLFAVNSYMNYSFSRLIISFLLMNITYYYVFRDNIKDCFIRSAIIYIILLLVEVILSVVIVNSGIESLVELNSEEITKFIFSIVNCLVAYMIVKIKWIKRISNKIIEKIRNKEVITVVIIVVLISFMLISHKYAISEYDYNLYKINISLLICYMCLFSIVIYEEYKRNILKAEQEAILRYMKSYEGIVDESNMKLYEVHNEVIILKSYKDRNSEEYNKMLDDMEKKYSKVGQTYKNINKLPEVIKGIIYTK